MLVVMEAAATAEQIAVVVSHIERVGLKALPIPGAHRTAIAVTGNQALKDPLAMVADGVGTLGWVGGRAGLNTYEYITELFGGAQLYGNKVLKEYRDKCDSLLPRGSSPS